MQRIADNRDDELFALVLTSEKITAGVSIPKQHREAFTENRIKGNIQGMVLDLKCSLYILPRKEVCVCVYGGI